MKNKKIFTLLLTLFLGSWTHKVCADDAASSFTLNLPGPPPVYSRALRGSSTSINSIADSLSTVLANPFFANRLPTHWGILLDGTWTLSSGYFSPDLQTPDGASAILFSPPALLSSDAAEPMLAHELTHLMHQQFRPQEESWVREGVALLAEWVVTGRYNPALGEAFANPETSLTAPLDPKHEDYGNVSNRSAEYGHILQYFIYIYRLCGKDELLNKLLTSDSSKSGVAFLNELLPSMNAPATVCSGFKQSFRAFAIARFQQNAMNPENYIILSALESTVREAPLALPAYSSEAYNIKSGTHCQTGEIPWGNSRCIRIRME